MNIEKLTLDPDNTVCVKVGDRVYPLFISSLTPLGVDSEEWKTLMTKVMTQLTNMYNERFTETFVYPCGLKVGKSVRVLMFGNKIPAFCYEIGEIGQVRYPDNEERVSQGQVLVQFHDSHDRFGWIDSGCLGRVT